MREEKGWVWKQIELKLTEKLVKIWNYMKFEKKKLKLHLKDDD